jgi:phosphoribosyl 1,2-cyclic phosphodiesterase
MFSDDPLRPYFENGSPAGIVQNGIIGDDIVNRSPPIKRHPMSLFGKNKVLPVISRDDKRQIIFANMKPFTM